MLFTNPTNYDIKSIEIMKNKHLIRIFAAVFVLVTGMNSYTGLVICFHDSGQLNIVTVESHSAYHGREVFSAKTCTNHNGDKILHIGEECNGCFDLPLHIKNLSVLKLRNNLDKFILLQYFPASDQVFNNKNLKTYKTCLDNIPKTPGPNPGGNTVLLI